MHVKEEIKKYLSENLLYLEDGFIYDDDTSFISEGLIDSTGIMELVAFVRSKFVIDVDQQDLTPDNFDSVNKLAGFVRRKAEAQKGSPILQ